MHKLYEYQYILTSHERVPTPQEEYLPPAVELHRGSGYGSQLGETMRNGVQQQWCGGGVWCVFYRITGRIHPSSRDCAASRFKIFFSNKKNPKQSVFYLLFVSKKKGKRKGQPSTASTKL